MKRIGCWILSVLVLCIPGIIFLVVMGTTAAWETTEPENNLDVLLIGAGAVFIAWFVLFVVLPRLDGKTQPKTQVVRINGYGRAQCDDVILELAGLANARKLGRQIGADVELELPVGFDSRLIDYDTWLNLEYLIKHPHYGVKVVQKSVCADKN